VDEFSRLLPLKIIQKVSLLGCNAWQFKDSPYVLEQRRYLQGQKGTYERNQNKQAASFAYSSTLQY
jgi:hypothetical protein